MTRLPTPGRDTGRWGGILNEFLDVAHNPDGSLDTNALGSAGAIITSNNLSDLQSVAAARTNLGLGSAATKDVGTTSGTVAAGDDSRIAGAVQISTLVYNVKDFGAKGDGTTDDSTALQATINAVTAVGGGTVLIPPTSAGYAYSTGLVITPMSLTSKLVIFAYGAKLIYNGTADGLLINTNISDSDAQYGERTVHTYGLHIVGSGSAACGIRNYGCSRASFKDTTLDGFTSATSSKAALILDARFHHWIEENHYDGLEIKNSGNGVLFISEDDSGGVAASCMNNVWSALSIWITQAGGRGIYGIGHGGTGLVQIARSVFNSVIIHPYNVANVIAFDLAACYCEGTVFTAPGVDFFGSAPSLIGFRYSGTNVLTIISPTIFPVSGSTTFFSGTGRYVVLGGNVPSTFTVDPSGNIAAPTLTLTYDIYDTNGKALIHQIAAASAVNHVAIGNAATGSPAYLTANGTDTNIGLSIYGKGTGTVLVNGTTPLPTPASNKTQYAIEGVTTNISGTYTADIMGYGQIQVMVATVLTGVCFLNGGTVTGNVRVALYNAAGTLVASSASTAQSGTFAMQRVAFSSLYTAAAGVYYVGVIPSSSTATFALTCCYGLSDAAAPGSFTVPGSITVPTAVGTYTIGASTY